MKKYIQSLVEEAIGQLDCGDIVVTADDIGQTVERTRDPRHGDFASNAAMTLARKLGRAPRELARDIIATLPESEQIDNVDIAGPGFINFTLSPVAYHREVCSILNNAERYGTSDMGEGTRVLVEFVSANPTGPLHIGHGRHAAYGATVSNLLGATGHTVDREYYVNDAGRQMNILGVSVWLRYLEDEHQETPFPAAAYRGQYIRDIAGELRKEHGDKLVHDADAVCADLPADEPQGDKDDHIDALIARARQLLGEDLFRAVLDVALRLILNDIRDDLLEFGVEVDEWFSERQLTASEAIQRALKKLQEHDRVYEKDGALWFRATDYGDEKDRVVIRENGQSTYFASDIAYHLNKRDRGYDLMLDVLGADHHGYVARVRAGLEAMGEPPESLEVRLVQFVSLYRGGKKMQMSTRSGEFITLRELRQDVGNDATRFFFIMRSNDQHLDFDTELAKSETSDNPVYYIQYAHARVCSVFKQLEAKNLKRNGKRGRDNLGLLKESHEAQLMRSLSRYPEVVELAAQNRAPHSLAHYLQSLANDFHTYYNAHQFIVDEGELRDARLVLIAATRQVIHNGLRLLGVSAPESM